MRALRNTSGLTQVELAERLDIAPETMSRIERGRLRPSTDLVARLASALGVAPGALFETGVVEVRQPTLRPVERRLLQLARGLPDTLVEDLVRGARLLIDVGRQAPPARRNKARP